MPGGSRAFSEKNCSKPASLSFGKHDVTGDGSWRKGPPGRAAGDGCRGEPPGRAAGDGTAPPAARSYMIRPGTKTAVPDQITAEIIRISTVKCSNGFSPALRGSTPACSQILHPSASAGRGRKSCCQKTCRHWGSRLRPCPDAGSIRTCPREYTAQRT